jgi:hypothetical protein
VLLAFVRLSVRAAIFERPLEAEEALDLIDGWLDLASRDRTDDLVFARTSSTDQASPQTARRSQGVR